MIWWRKDARLEPAPAADIRIPALTQEKLAEVRRLADSPGQHAQSWTTLTRLVRERLGQAATTTRSGFGRESRYASHHNYLRLRMDQAHALEIDFGIISSAQQRIAIGTLAARWGPLGLTGPYVIGIRERPESLSTFCGVLEPYLALPREAQNAT